MNNIYKLLPKFKTSSMFLWISIMILRLNASQSWGQTTLFNDNFNTNNSATFSTTGAIGTYPNWSVTRSDNDWGARVNSNILELSNDASATSNSNGWAFGYRDVNALAGWNTILSSNTGTITSFFHKPAVSGSNFFISETSSLSSLSSNQFIESGFNNDFHPLLYSNNSLT